MTTATPEPGTSPRRVRVSSWLLGTLTGLLLALVAVSFAYFTIFGEVRGDDEGYLMISVKGFLDGHALYDEVFTQYGPFYYFYQWLLRSIVAIPLTHDATRLLGIVHWLTAAGLLGLTGGFMTRSVLGGLFVFMQAVVHLTPMAGEPGHPQELVVVMLALSALTAAAAPNKTLTPVLLGLIGAALTLTKVNVGVFFGLASLLALYVHATGRLQHRGWIALVLGLVAPLPLLLMRAHLGDPWYRNYSLIVVASLVATFLAANSWSERQATGLRPYAQLALGFAVTSFALLGITLLHGSSVQGLIDGLIVTPLSLPGVGWLRRPVSAAMLPNAVIALAVAIAMLRAGPTCRSLLPLLKGAYGLAGALWLVGDAGLQLVYLLPWSWLIMAPTTGTPESSARSTVPRAFLAFTAVWQSLQAYPVAGTQVAVGTAVMVVIYTLCLTDAFRELAVRRRLEIRWPTLGKPAGAYPWMVALALLILFQNVWCRPQDARERYAQLTALDLPGTRRLRLTTDSVLIYRELMDYLERSSDTFITYPGFNSFYFWTGKPPPTFWNATGWGPLSPSQRLDILAALRRAQRPLLVIHESPLGSWAHGVPPELEPLVRCLRDECEPVQRFGPFVVFRLRDTPPAAE
jgi:hypothetical protein